VSEKIKVMLVDDHTTFRQPLAFMLGQEQDIAVVAQTGSLSEAREILENGDLVVDVAIVDLDQPDASGTVFIRDLHRSRPRATALVLSALSERAQLARAIEAGAAGVMHKSTRMEDLLEAVRRLHAGEQLLSQKEVIEALRLVVRERESEREAQLAIDKLTPREREVLLALAEGLGDREIAERLYVGTGTVHTHITSILAKLEVSSRLQALVFAVRHGVVTID
jgi:DNA-binding NarL/FixJ family response regulator